MKHNSTIISLTAASFFALAASANASDLLDSLNDPAPEHTRTYFHGLAVGIDGGGQFTSVAIDDKVWGMPFEFDGISSDGLIGGAHVEYLFAADRFRFGAYGEGGFSNVNTELEWGGISAELQQDHYYGAGLKAGITAGGNTLLFARVGYDWSQWTASRSWVGFPAFSAKSETDVGSWLIGGGIETMISENLSLGLGADYLIVDDVEAAGEDLTKIFDDSEMLRVKARLTWRQ
jgi:opacity protein-like surface antigen